LPVIVSDVGSLRADVVIGETGYICEPEDPVDLAAAIERYFASPLYRDLDCRRQRIREYVEERHSWNAVGETTQGIYRETLGLRP
jgi:glycosyltransferase involved in cell wall biosynthesis